MFKYFSLSPSPFSYVPALKILFINTYVTMIKGSGEVHITTVTVISLCFKIQNYNITRSACNYHTMFCRWDLTSSLWQIRRCLSSGMLHCVLHHHDHHLDNGSNKLISNVSQHTKRHPSSYNVLFYKSWVRVLGLDSWPACLNIITIPFFLTLWSVA
jgi:hypothetical protein